MKANKNAKERREAEAARRREVLTGRKAAAGTGTLPGPQQERTAAAGWKANKIHSNGTVTAPALPSARKAEPQKTPEEETREFLAYLENMRIPADVKQETPDRRNGKSGGGRIPVINLEEGMPLVEEAVSSLRYEMDTARRSGIAAVKLIHGYGSTGRGGKIKRAVHQELKTLKAGRWIRTFIPGEEFGPFNPESRSLNDRNPRTAKDPDWGTCNQGITVVVIK